MPPMTKTFAVALVDAMIMDVIALLIVLFVEAQQHQHLCLPLASVEELRPSRSS
jgi:hypothetical protein